MMLHLASNLKRKNELDHKRRGHLHVLMPSKAGSLNGYGLMISVSDDVIGIGNWFSLLIGLVVAFFVRARRLLNQVCKRFSSTFNCWTRYSRVTASGYGACKKYCSRTCVCSIVNDERWRRDVGGNSKVSFNELSRKIKIETICTQNQKPKWQYTFAFIGFFGWCIVKIGW